MSTVQASSAGLNEYGTESFMPVDALSVDHNYQRPTNQLRIRQMTPFAPSLVGRLTVSQRTDGTFWVVDGQHRLEAAKRNGVSSVPCTVYKGWTMKDEAWIYSFRNRTQIKPSQYDIHKASVLFGDPIALDLEKIVAEIGGAIGSRNSPAVGTRDHIACVDSLRRIYGMKNEHGRYPIERYPKQNGREHLRKTLHVINAAWGDIADTAMVRPFHGGLVRGMAVFLWHASDDPNFEEGKLIEALRRPKATPFDIMNAANHTAVGIPRALAREIKNRYNAHARTRKLGDWDVNDLPK